MEIKVKTEAQHHCKLVEWDSISALGCTPIKQNVIERDFDIEEHNKIIYNQALEDFANTLTDGEQNEEFVYNIEKIVKRLRK